MPTSKGLCHPEGQDAIARQVAWAPFSGGKAEAQCQSWLHQTKGLTLNRAYLIGTVSLQPSTP